MDNNGEDSPSEESSMQVPAYGETVNFESYTCAPPVYFPHQFKTFPIPLKTERITEKW